VEAEVRVEWARKHSPMQSDRSPLILREEGREKGPDLIAAQSLGLERLGDSEKRLDRVSALNGFLNG